MSILEELPELPEDYRWAMEQVNGSIQFGYQTNGLVSKGTAFGHKGTWFWHRYCYINFELEDDDAEILSEIESVADRYHVELLEELHEYKEERQRRLEEDRIRREKSAKAESFIERNWNGKV